MAERVGCIWVLAGTNGAGRSSIGGALLRHSGGEYYNPDEVARTLREQSASLDAAEANALAWRIGLHHLDRAIARGDDFFFETTLGGRTITRRLQLALSAGLQVRIWYAGLRSPELHVERVAARVRAGGHDIPQEAIRRRFDSSRRNLVVLLPRLSELKVYDNSKAADPARGERPVPDLVLHWRAGRIVAPRSFGKTPDWAKPIVAQALKHATTK